MGNGSCASQKNELKMCWARRPKPRAVWQKQFDGFHGDLQRMAQLDWDKIPESDLWYFFHDMAYMDLQPDLFRHAFPTCLKVLGMIH